MELSNLNLSELRELHDAVAKELDRRTKIERSAAVEQIYRLAHQFNIPLKELLDGEKKLRKHTDPPAHTYRDPNNPAHTWSGRGPRPRWLKAAIADGAKLEDFRV